MKLYEIDKSDIRKYGNYTKVINAGLYCIRDDHFVRSAFNFGNGNISDMNDYMRNNSMFCAWIDVDTMKRVYSV